MKMLLVLAMLCGTALAGAKAQPDIRRGKMVKATELLVISDVMLWPSVDTKTGAPKTLIAMSCIANVPNDGYRVEFTLLFNAFKMGNKYLHTAAPVTFELLRPIPGKATKVAALGPDILGREPDGSPGQAKPGVVVVYTLSKCSVTLAKDEPAGPPAAEE